MTLEQFAKHCGVKLLRREPENGCAIVYSEADYPNTTIGSFRTEQTAYKHWLASTFGGKTGRAVQKLLRDSEKSRPARRSEG
jgi:hypothetical protein